MSKITREKAIELVNSKFWESMSPRAIAVFQLWEDRLCMPFDVFHEAIEKVLGRPVYTHEFGLNRDGLKKELMGEKESPTLEEIIDLIPEDKRVIICEIPKA